MQETHATPGKKPVEVFGKKGKFASKQFYDELQNISEEAKDAIEARAYAEGLLFFKAFNAYGTGEIVREYMRKNG